jgi:competence protein ComFB
MKIKNMMEDIVFSLIKEISKDQKLDISREEEQNIAAYVLNRVPSKYVTSERGVLHNKIDEKFLFQERTDIMFLAYEAINLTKDRRKQFYPNNTSDVNTHSGTFRHIIGEVAEISTFNHVYDLEIGLYLDGELAPMMDETWCNPFVTNKATKGYYHFWPKLDPEKYKVGDKAEFELKFSHPKFEDKETKIFLTVYKEFDISKSKIIPISLLKLNEGQEMDFLL